MNVDVSQLPMTIALLTTLAVFFLVCGIALPVTNIIVPDKDDDDTPAGGLGAKYARPMAQSVLSQLPLNIQDTKLNELIVKSGNPWKLSPSELISACIGFSFVGLIAGIVLAVFAPSSLTSQVPPIIFPLLLPILLGLYPYAKYRSARNERARTVTRDLPEALDLLTITMATGQAFEPALRTVIPHLPEGLLKELMTRASLEIQAGTSLSNALTNASVQTDSKELASFATAIIESSQLGNDVTETLGQQATFARQNYEAFLERMIARLETNMMIPLMFTMMPALLVILVAPVMSQIGNVF